MTTIARSGRRMLRLSHTCDIRRVPPGGSAAGRETVVAGLRCSAVYPASLEQAERTGMATAARLLVVYTDAATVAVDQRLATAGQEFRIRAVSPWPWAAGGDDAAVQFLELLVEDET